MDNSRHLAHDMWQAVSAYESRILVHLSGPFGDPGGWGMMDRMGHHL